MTEIEAIEASGYSINEDLTITNKLGLSMKFQNSTGYPMVGLTVLGVRKRFLVHRLFASKFIPNPDNLPVVNHIDFNRENFKLSNLEWTTTKDNVEHSLDNILKAQCKVKFILLSPRGAEVEVGNLRAWTREMGYPYSSFGMLVSGKRKTTNGWSLVSRVG